MDENSIIVLKDGEEVTVKEFYAFVGQEAPWPPRDEPIIVDPPADDPIVKPASRAQDEFALRQFQWYKNEPYDQKNTWLYDRVQFLYELGIRTDNTEVLVEAKRSAEEYIKHYGIGAYGLNWGGAGVRNGDMKYTYASAPYYLHIMEGKTLDEKLLLDLRDGLYRVGWFGISWDNPWEEQRMLWNERAAGYSLMGMYWLSMLDVDGAYDRMAHMVDYLFDAQSSSGWWLHSYNGHEGAAGQDAMCASPWMSCIIGGALSRIANSYEGMGIADKAQVMLNKLALAQFEELDYDVEWSHGYNETGYASKYFVMPANRVKEKEVQRSSGWYSDLHIPEVTLCMQAGGFEPPFDIKDFFTEPMLGLTSPARMPAWMNSHFE